MCPIRSPFRSTRATETRVPCQKGHISEALTAAPGQASSPDRRASEARSASGVSSGGKVRVSSFEGDDADAFEVMLQCVGTVAVSREDRCVDGLELGPL